MAGAASVKSIRKRSSRYGWPIIGKGRQVSWLKVKVVSQVGRLIKEMVVISNKYSIVQIYMYMLLLLSLIHSQFGYRDPTCHLH